MRIYRLFDGKKWPPAKKGGFFVLGDPKAGAEKHHAHSEVLVREEDEAIRLIQAGYSIRVESKTSPSLVRKNLYLDDVKAT